MATRNIVPRSTGEGSIGTTVKRWLNGFFDNITLARVSVNNNEISPIDDNAVNFGAALKRWLNGFFISISTGILKISSGGTDKAYLQTELGTEHFHIDLQENGGTFHLVGKSNGGEDRHMIHANPEFGVRLYEKGVNTFEVVEAAVYLFGLRPIIIEANNGSIQFQGSAGGWAVGNYFRNPLSVELGTIGATGVDDVLSYLFMGKTHQDTGVRVYPDAQTELYYNGARAFYTNNSGVNIESPSDAGKALTMAWNGANWTIRSTSHGDPIYLDSEDSGGVVRHIVGGDPDGNAQLYQDGDLRCITYADGISVHTRGGSAAFARESVDWTLRSFTPGARMFLSGLNASGSVKNIVGGDPDGEAYITWAGTIKLATRSNGVYVAGTVQATGSDVAEKYTCAEKEIIPGTVMKACDSGDYEVEECNTEFCGSVVGVCSVDPGYVMNSESEGIVVGLTGKIPVRIMGPIGKGKPIVPAGKGAARAIKEDSELLYKIGQSLEENLEQEEKLVMCIIK